MQTMTIQRIGTQKDSTSGYINSKEEGEVVAEVNYTYTFLAGKLHMIVWQGNDIVLENH